MHSSDLEAFHLYEDCEFSCESVWKWVRIVAQKNVQHITLHHCGYTYPPPAIFCCTNLRTLKLAHYNLSLLPTHFDGFRYLNSCIFHSMGLTDEILARFISHCPFLQKLDLEQCVGLQKPIISSLTIAHLCVTTFYGYQLTVNCQNLITLKTRSHIKDLKVNGVTVLRAFSCNC